jgi:hypothetical protein
MKAILTYTLIFACFICYSQNINIEKNVLFDVFEKTIVQNSKNIISTASNPWFTNNTDSIYFKSDTVVFINANSYRREYCKVINWNFYDRNKFVLSDADYCNEPPLVKVNTTKDWFEVKFEEEGNILKLYNDKNLISEFEVLEISLDESQSILKLLRLNER